MKQKLSSEECKSKGFELGISNPCSLNVSLESDDCNATDNTKEGSNGHIKNRDNEADKMSFKLKEINLGKEISSLKLRLLSTIYELNESESSKRHICTCRNYCRIFHKKHNWSRSIGQEAYKQFGSMYPCEPCDKEFQMEAKTEGIQNVFIQRKI